MENIEKEILKLLKSRNWDNPSPSNLAKSISIESAELLECFQWINPTLEELENDKLLFSDIRKELADIMIYCLEFTILLKLNPSEIILDKLKEIDNKYPIKSIKNNDKEYYKIKKEIRNKRQN